MKDNTAPKVNIFSEIQPLKKVLVHRPSGELLNLVPDYLSEMLFDDIPWLEVAQSEHDYMVSFLSGRGTEIVYFKDLVAQSVLNNDIKTQLITDYINEADIFSSARKQMLTEYLSSLSVPEMVNTMISGLRKGVIDSTVKDLSDYLQSDYPFELSPMPNLYFSRDGFSFVGNGVIVSKMKTHARARENLFADYIFKYHPDYKDIPCYYNRNNAYSIEGGDILVLNDTTLIVGISERTHVNAIEELAHTLFNSDSGFTKILAIDIPKKRAYMHLDTVFTMVDKNVFSIHRNTKNSFITLLLNKKGESFTTTLRDMPLADILKEALGAESVKLIKCGGDNVIDSSREQWNDGANTLCIAPGEVVVYARNSVTNNLFEQNGIKTYKMPCSELSRGRGGPRCMTMPIIRKS